MSQDVELLEGKFRQYAEAHGAASEQGDYKTANRNYDKLLGIVAKLRVHGAQGEAALRRLMKDRSDAVAAFAATRSLPFAEADALEVLEAIARKAGAVGFNAEMVIKEWKGGRLVIR